jgi:hypothetical protein
MSTIDKPISLSDSRMAAVLRAATQLRREDVENYMQLVAQQLRVCSVIGDGSVHRAIEVVQRRYIEPPVLEGHYGATK